MTYLVSFKPSFLADYVQLGRNMQKRINFAVAELEQKPVTPRAATIKNLKYHKKLWRYRIGDYRMVYAAYPEKELVQLLAIGPRSEIYERMGYHPDEPQYDDYSDIFEEALDPDQEKPVEWLQYLKPEEEVSHSQDLPYHLTPERLSNWGVPEKFHHLFEGCKNEDDLQNCGAPETYIYHLVDCLWPATATEIVDDPNYVLQNPQDLSRYAAGDLEAFLLLLDKDQENLIDWALQGPTLVKGGPGSGKSTVAMYRIRELTIKAAKEKKSIKILFTTYTRALVDYSRQLINYLLENIKDHDVNIEITTLDAVARRIVSQFDGYPMMASMDDLKYALTSGHSNLTARSKSGSVSADISKSLQTVRDDYLLEEFEWVIEGQGIETLGEYLNADRSGRGYAFSQLMRENVWLLYESYKNFLDTLEKTSWGGLRKQALEISISKINHNEKYDFVIVDEAQDLTPVALGLCVEICKSPAGIFLTADASQSIYNKGFSWINVHESMRVTGRSRVLKRNYRTTRQIAMAAHSIIKTAGAGDEEALDQIFIHVGPKPTIYEALDESESFTWLANNLNKAASELKMPLSSIAILGAQNWMAEKAAECLTNLGLKTTYVSGGEINMKTPSAKALTLHSSKGLEFPIVAIIYAEEGFIPRDLRDYRKQDLEKHLAKENRLLFVGMTRAMRRLFVVHRCGKKSSFLDNIDLSLWNLRSFA
jgi:superfamily I DNA/RNA helicase/mRNA-degrading endonuclease RelE of RelBE toxin-antitoxin system